MAKSKRDHRRQTMAKTIDHWRQAAHSYQYKFEHIERMLHLAVEQRNTAIKYAEEWKTKYEQELSKRQTQPLATREGQRQITRRSYGV